MRLLIGIQCRSGSTRFPGKAYELIGTKSVLEHVVIRCEDAKATLLLKHDNWNIKVGILGPQVDVKLQEYCLDRKWLHFGGHETDLITRYVQACELWNPDRVIRITGDCWNINPKCIIEVAEALHSHDYASNTIVRSYPEGNDCQGCKRRALEWFDKYQKTEREHPFYPFDVNDILRKKFVSQGFSWCNVGDLANPLFDHNSIDHREDLEKARARYAQL